MCTKMKRLIPALLLALLASQVAVAACPEDREIETFVADFAKRQPSKALSNELSAADAECAKRKLAKKLPAVLGSPIGYKAAFTNPVMQQRFGVDGPKWGYMYDRNMIDIIAVLSTDMGTRMQFEADLIVEVKDAGLADANTPLEALAHLESVVPFIELPDLALEAPFSGNRFVAANVGFRGGVTGQEIPVKTTQAFADAMANMTVVMVDEGEDNKELGRVKGSVLMEHPLNAAIWLAKALKQSGITLKQGDLLSLGSFIPPQPAKPGQKIRLQYLGLPGDPALTVEFN